jgi:hypothetical protein
MAGPWIAFLIAVGIVSVIIYRLQNRRSGRRWSSDTAGGDVGYASSGSSTWSLTDWFSSSAPSDASGNPSEGGGSSGSWDSGGDTGGGGDSGGDGGSSD